ncbi:glucose-induced degradation protein 4 homolog [Folsomia candida]|uniref:glucose-induced degradation protein 4 homolog n=1 Tax=Folsomia candida TaxID=158441 RepID=UPI0016053BA7|nr:glucose-induced degradation protein 4 homolog [Folsomia candida]XP_035705929.1 glucose-induced degradation protein 4 homolog [Folsomia candida]
MRSGTGRSRTHSHQTSKRKEGKSHHHHHHHEISSAVITSSSSAISSSVTTMRLRESEIAPPPLANKNQPGLPSNSIYSGSKFDGSQKSRGNSYDVEITFKNVDVQNSHICGYLTIKGLTEEHPIITTFFDGEIISRKYPFLTRKWDADEEIDRKHWAKFTGFTPYTKSFNSDNFDFESLATSDNVFMRLKEQFFVYPENVKDIAGVSFAGFYYICSTNSTATMEGYYYHRGAEWGGTDNRYQSLTLSHIPEKSIQIYQFR